MSFFQFVYERRDDIVASLIRHIWLTGISVGIATVIGVALGILIIRFRRLAAPTLGAAGIVQTIPGIALLGLMIPLFGIGVLPALVALSVYAVLPIVRNTYTGIAGVDPTLIEAGIGMGMTNRQLLTLVQLPLALPVMMAGIRTATVISVGVATLASPIGAGGLGDQIFQGIHMVDNNMIFAGAIPAALLALTLDAMLGLVERRLTPGSSRKGRKAQITVGNGIVA